MQHDENLNMSNSLKIRNNIVRKNKVMWPTSILYAAYKSYCVCITRSEFIFVENIKIIREHRKADSIQNGK